MVNVTDATKTAYKTDSVSKQMTIRIPEANITLTNSDIVSQSMTLTEAIENSDNLSFTGCIASVFKITCADIIQDIQGMWIEADIQASNTETIPLFRGYIDNTTNHSHEQNTMELVAYDALKKINERDVTAWYNSLPATMNIKNFRDSFFQHCGVTQVDDYLPNDGITIRKTLEDKTINGSKIIKAICQINGRYGRISRTGNFEYVHLVEGTEALYPREDLYPADDIYPSDENALDQVNKARYKNISFENYRVNVIDKLQIVGKDGQIIATVGTGNNTFTVKDNFLIWELSQSVLNSVARNLYNTIQGLWYTPATVDCVGLPYVECGDFVLMATKRSIVRAYVLERNLKGIQALSDNYNAKGDREQPKYTPSVQTQITANTQAIRTESVRATSAESGLQTNINTEARTRASADSNLQSGLNNEANIRANQISAVNVRCDNLVARDAQIENLVATKASISDLNATNATVGSLSAQVANVGNLVASKANISDLQAANARIANLEATRATIDYVNSKVQSASQGTFNAIRVAGTEYRGSVRVVTTYHAYDCLGNQVY